MSIPKGIFFTIWCVLFTLQLNAQIIQLSPATGGADEEVTLIFDAELGNGELMGASKVYAHHGVVLSSPTGTDWNLVIGNWGMDDGVGEMTKIPGTSNKWQLPLSPTIRAHFGAASNASIYRISAVFRNASGNIKGTATAGAYGWGTIDSNLDFFIDINNDHFVSIDAPIATESFLNAGESITISGSASASVSSMKLWIDEGQGFVQKASVNSGQSITYNYEPSSTQSVNVKIDATINGQNLSFEKEFQIVVVQPNEIAAIPMGNQYGINYNMLDDQKVTLAIEAPQKQFIYAIGDFNNWQISDAYQMKQTPDGEGYWIELNGLNPGQQYVFQYWVDGELKIADPYTDMVADPWHDQWIESSVFPNLPIYDQPDYGIASVFETGQENYDWSTSENSWNRPDIDHLTIYELHIRDFLGSHSYTDLIDTLSYLERLGVNAIELMPINEFEGNDSWGYNPSYFFAPDKYYGTKNQLKKLIETCHQKGMAVILDIVLNHAYGQNPMVQLYIDDDFRISANNPWFNRDYVGQYQWGFDFNHESSYTQRFIDRINAYWLEEYHFDGFRFDFTKGFTNNAPNGSIDGFDQSRIDLLKRMGSQIKNVDPTAYMILEHWAPFQEENLLAQEGFKMWRNKSYDFIPATIGKNEGNLNGMSDESHVAFFDSHDERRIAEHVINEGLKNGSYNITDSVVMYERVKLAAAFAFLQPGPKMMWQFDELGYDIHIDFNGRIGRKPLPWGAGSLKYYESPLRQYIYEAYAGILNVRNIITPQKLASAQTNHKLTGYTKRLSYQTGENDLVVIGNFGLEQESIVPIFTKTGIWYDYFSGEEMEVMNVTSPILLKPGEWHIYTSEKISEGFPGVVVTYGNPVTISPNPFTKNDEITITFDASKAFNDGTDGLVGAEKVYFHSGLILQPDNNSQLEHVVGTLQDDGLGQMVHVEGDLWEITLVVQDYYNLTNNESPYQIGMYFRDALNENLGKGFRNEMIYFDIDSDIPFIRISPKNFNADDQITITFNTNKGNKELLQADKIYMHSSMGIVDTETPASTAWEHVIGNWGQDDGIGQLTQSASNTDLWEITLVPKDYYGLSTGEFPYWLAAVFRSADGNIKGTGEPGLIENGFIAENNDFFIQNQFTTSVAPINLKSNIIIVPNPNNGVFQIQNLERPFDISIIDVSGNRVFKKENCQSGLIDISSLANGMYFFQIEKGEVIHTGKLIKQ